MVGGEEIPRITYRNKDFCREVVVRTADGDGRLTVYANGRLSFDVVLKPGQAWHRCLIYDLVDGSKSTGRRGNVPIPALSQVTPAIWTSGSEPF
jgi:hypothetical protein